MKDTYGGYSSATWDTAKREMTLVLRRCAARRQMVCYSDLLRGVTTIRFDVDDVAYHRMLGEISESEDSLNRGMLSAIVVHKTGDQEPGRGLHELAATLGRDTSDKLKCWIDEVKAVFDVWANRRTTITTTP